jgi:hypothetical protein
MTPTARALFGAPCRRISPPADLQTYARLRVRYGTLEALGHVAAAGAAR